MSIIGLVLQLDLGNSRLKWRLIDCGGGTVLGRGACAPLDDAWLQQPVAVAAVQVASVASDATDAALAARVRDRFAVEPWFARATPQCGDLSNSYAEPQRMGVDRWLAMVAARARCRERLCVVDAGSALTIDLVAADGRHEGGYIIPGSALMARALQTATDRVRFDDGEGDSLAPGQSTAACVYHGIALAQAGALQLALMEAQRQGAAPRVLLTGGAARQLRRLLGGLVALPLELAEDLVLDGLALAARS
ncbi:type III pantothenate kinase [Pseudohaliea rubra]|uniref:Type III pantothenate kinase n=1 Tax=Pseudohaliea rubra DSM 19751 TaxID=1265313 RepID=A0A095WW94_9GAMM|nr:type III pantothenate kinase [Pseudohaliea rubra]KGE02919.1 Pantothenate kinase type III, CoaX-like protein [Pseudohaliea rubra DSM 19751]